MTRGIVACTLALVLGAILGAGCAGRQVPVVPEAIQSAERVAEQAGRLQDAENWKGAAQWWERAGRQFQLLNLRTNLAIAWHNEGICLAESGDVTEARLLWQQALELNRVLGVADAAWRNEIALLQWEESAALAERADALEKRLASGEAPPSPVTAAVLNYALAGARFRLGETGIAESRMAGVEERFVELGDLRAAGAAQVLKARLDAAAGRAGESVTAWRKALATYEKVGYPRGIAAALSGLGTSLAERGGDVAEARLTLLQALENQKALGLTREAAETEAVLGRLGER